MPLQLESTLLSCHVSLPHGLGSLMVYHSLYTLPGYGHSEQNSKDELSILSRVLYGFVFLDSISAELTALLQENRWRNMFLPRIRAHLSDYSSQPRAFGKTLLRIPASLRIRAVMAKDSTTICPGVGIYTI